ncbi:hypothetical protein SEA_COLUCCI_41 [Arthrobacter phage Colucci]|uniref:Uncharacterized protein n=1 Tax=Arthrobacter phage Colucci TaxID=2015834 RepID=A0A286N2V5_9CAUD|nr:hypothetical protein FDI27_gp041 [Arthrobacter phage Colucci]ASX98712.1 hypothetical protein SEA_COLUCCI_41 [Arthrobacter phage Colucci]
MLKFRNALARFAAWFAGNPPVHTPPAPPKTRLEELHDQRMEKVYARAMAALESRPKDMTDKDRLIFARSIVNMLERNVHAS